MARCDGVVTAELFILDSLELRGHEEECSSAVAPAYVRGDASSLARLSSGVLLCYALGVTCDEQLATSDYGKPYLVGGCPPFFNLSNDGRTVVLAVATDVIGVDVQAIGLSDEAVMRRHFPAEAYREFASAPPEDKPLVFARYWTSLESRLKALGTGLSVDYRNHPELFDGLFTHHFQVDDIMIACTMRQDFESSIRRLHLADIQKHLETLR